MVWRGTWTPLNEIDPPPAGSALIPLWWLAFLLGSICGAISSAVGFDPTTGSASLAIFNAIITIPTVVAAVSAIVIVRRITEGQERRQAALDQHWESTLVPTSGVLQVDAAQAWPPATLWPVGF